jgi:hypothetical protein
LFHASHFITKNVTAAVICSCRVSSHA